MKRSLVGIAVALSLLLGLVACKGGADVPEPWAKMKLPIGDGEVTSGSNATNLFVMYDDTGDLALVPLFGAYTLAMTNAGCAAKGPVDKPIAGVWEQEFLLDGKPLKITMNDFGGESGSQIEITFDENRF